MKNVFDELFAGTPLKKYISFFILFAMALIIFFLSYSSYYPKDNLIEQAVEEEITNITGLELDLSPEPYPHPKTPSENLADSVQKPVSPD